MTVSAVAFTHHKRSYFITYHSSTWHVGHRDTFEGWIPTFTVAPFTFSRWIRSMWITYFLR